MQKTKVGEALTWREAFAVYTKRPVVTMLFLGFSAGLPLLLVFSTLTAWLRDEGISRTTIGFFAWVGITYSIKVLWAPVVDSLRVPFFAKLGIRRSWMLVGQLGICASLIAMVLVNPGDNIALVAVFAVLVAFFSSTQDIAIDAFRIESAVDEYQGAMSASYIFGYRLALLVAGAGALYLADFYSWEIAYFAMAACMSVGILTVLVSREPQHERNRATLEREANLEKKLHVEKSSKFQRWFVDSVISPFVDFFSRNGKQAVIILLFIGVFRLSDITMGIMANPFYLDLGFSKSEIASVAKIFGFFMTILGSALAGVLVVKWGIYRTLLLGAALVASTNVLFAVLAQIGPNIEWLAIVISADNLSGGIASVAFIAYLSSLTNRAYTATQYALFSSLMTLPGKFVSGFSGVVVDTSGYADFFIIAAVLGLPAILLTLYLMKIDKNYITKPTA